ncbi:LrgB-like family-domain-containing protein [Emericellopsis atlantica]|uniref:LrgB-like family-domain-containing protein n=1 Tax=Emericellopsis atlantica TaxID=2614577 RepID=A0A9P7ZFH1_9HYPO|nr:LrgB-like family-domain-containing protein [Emericellopsis atlantica]KAG9251153.1 LrgB-like family-domain-containing protein [Emericellopsis atlantica]
MACSSFIEDALKTLRLSAQSSARHVVHSWIYVPVGLALMLLTCFGVDSFLRHVNVTFPASVACLVLLFVALLICEAVLGSHRTRKLVALLDVPAGWALRWMSIFFMPPFVLLPLSPRIGVIEVFKIIAVFLIGFVVMMALAAYLTRSLHLLLGSSKKSMTQRAEELDPSQEHIPLADAAPTPSETPPRGSFSGIASPPASRPQTPPQLRLQNHHHATQQVVLGDHVAARSEYMAQDPVPPDRCERWAAVVSSHLDTITYSVLTLVGLPIYYTTDFPLPLQLPLTVLCYMFLSALPPPSWRTYLHPVLTASLVTVLLLWFLAFTKGIALATTLHSYRTGAKYLTFWRDASTHPPGAGDIFATLLDASIMALALPTFQHRRELRAHFAPLLVPSVLISVGSLLAYPPLCYSIGIEAKRSLAFASRSLTLALATPATENLGGDLNTAAALAIVSGIFGVLVGPRMLAIMHIPEDDYVTRGVTLGVNSSAIATALLLKTDPRAAALSCLSMILFGTVTVIFTSIPPVANVIRGFVGL